MKTTTRIWIALIVLTACGAFAQEDTVERLTVPFSDPSKPGAVEAGLMNGGITVTGYPGKEVQIEAVARMKKLDSDEGGLEWEFEFDSDGRARREERHSRSGEEEKEEKKRKDLSGLKRISHTSSSLEVTEKDNVIEISAGAWNTGVDLRIRVPYHTSLQLSTLNNGDILVKDVTGELEVKALNGSVRMENVGGVVVTNSHNGGVTAVMSKADKDKPMAFTSFNGDVDVTLPADARANVKMNTQNGDIYTDFEIQKSKDPAGVIHDDSEGGVYHVRIERSFYGTINGGGPEFQLRTFNGDIILRKGK